MVSVDNLFVKEVERVTAKMIGRLVANRNKQQRVSGEPITTFNGAACLIRPADSGVSRITGLGVLEPWREGMIAALEELLRDQRALCEITMNPFAPVSLSNELIANNWNLAYWIQVMASDLREPVPSIPYPEDRFTLKQVGSSSVDNWAVIMAQGFEDFLLTHQSDPLTHRNSAEIEGMQCFLAQQGGVDVGAASMNLIDEFAMMYAASTLRPYRNKGIHTSLLKHRMKVAKKEGAHYAALLTVPGSQAGKNATRLGFHLLYTQPVYYKSFVEN